MCPSCYTNKWRHVHTPYTEQKNLVLYGWYDEEKKKPAYISFGSSYRCNELEFKGCVQYLDQWHPNGMLKNCIRWKKYIPGDIYSGYPSHIFQTNDKNQLEWYFPNIQWDRENYCVSSPIIFGPTKDKAARFMNFPIQLWKNKIIPLWKKLVAHPKRFTTYLCLQKKNIPMDICHYIDSFLWFRIEKILA